MVGARGGEAAAGVRPGAPRPRVVVVDDERAIRLLCRVNLQLAGFDVAEAANGREALELIAKDPPDLVLLDLMMPDVDGWEVAERLARGRATRSIPVVFLSARSSGDDRRRGYEVGAVDYVVKPFDPLALAPRLARTLERIGRGERDDLRRELLDSDRRV